MTDKKQNKILHFFGILAIVFLSIVAVCYSIYFARAEINYSHNVKAWQQYNHTGLIRHQYIYKDLKYGFGNVASNGCGAIAVYNILTLENINADFPKIIKQFDMGGENVFGLGGSKPSKVMTLLRHYGFDVTYTLDFSKFEDVAKKSKYAIYLYFGMSNFVPFGHYQLLYDFNGKNYETININGRYAFEDITDIKDTFLQIMIGINKK